MDTLRTNFVNCAQLSKFHSYVTCPPMSRHFTFTEGSRLVRVRCYLHDDTHAAEGLYPPAERVLEFSKPFYWRRALADQKPKIALLRDGSKVPRPHGHEARNSV